MSETERNLKYKRILLKLSGEALADQMAWELIPLRLTRSRKSLNRYTNRELKSVWSLALVTFGVG